MSWVRPARRAQMMYRAVLEEYGGVPEDTQEPVVRLMGGGGISVELSRSSSSRIRLGGESNFRGLNEELLGVEHRLLGKLVPGPPIKALLTGVGLWRSWGVGGFGGWGLLP